MQLIVLLHFSVGLSMVTCGDYTPQLTTVLQLLVQKLYSQVDACASSTVLKLVFGGLNSQLSLA